MNMRRLGLVGCFTAIAFSGSIALAGGGHHGGGSQPAFARSAPSNGGSGRATAIARPSSFSSRARPSSFSNRRNGSAIIRNSNPNFRRSNFNRVNLNNSNRNWTRRTSNLDRSSNWIRRNRTFDRDNFRRRNCHNRFVFVGSFGFPWYYSSFYDYYPYSYYPYNYSPYSYDPYAYSYSPYYNGGVYQGSPDYGSAPEYEDGGQYDGGSYDNGGAYPDSGHNKGSLIARVQQRLARDGYYRGSIDGVLGSRTYYAIRAYERDHHLRVDGAIDEELLGTMGLR